jgi:hypothetical protein
MGADDHRGTANHRERAEHVPNAQWSGGGAEEAEHVEGDRSPASVPR